MHITLSGSQWFLVGAFTMLFLFFITHYFTRRSEKYNLYFSIGCILTILKVLILGLLDSVEYGSTVYYQIGRLDSLTFLWGPFIYILLSDSLFPEINKKIGLYIFAGINVVMSIFILFVKLDGFPYYNFYDYIIILEMLYSSLIVTIALIRRKKYSVPIFAANAIFFACIIHDVLLGSYIIENNLGEMFGYGYLIYMYVASFVQAIRLKKLDLSRMESQIRFLHAQIQPHFLYNTINTIVAYCRTDAEESRKLLIELSTYLRGKFKIEKDMFTPLKKEIELIKSYLTIEQVRFKERLNVQYDIDEECNILIPCLVLQPMVENAVRHGLIPKMGEGTISISVKRIANNVVVKIKDNGIGMNMSDLPDILEGKRSGIGLSNTNERLKKYYNTQIEVESQAGRGTEVTVTIPTDMRKKA